MRRIFCNRKYSGYVWHFIFVGLFIGLSLLFAGFLKGSAWYTVSSALRLIFGTAILITASKLFGRSPKDILSMKNTGKALIAGAGFLLFFLYYMVTVASGIGKIAGLTTGLFVTKVILQQLTTGFYEELNYRFLLLEGIKHTKNNAGIRIGLVFLSSILFGLLHCATGWDTYRFLQTGAIGFAFAVIFVNSGNIVIPMLLHFLYDIIANMTDFIEWEHNAFFDNVSSVFEIALVVMFVISLVTLIIGCKKKS